MAAISAMVGLGLATASLGYGLYNKFEAQGEMEQANASKQMAYMQQAAVAKKQSGISKEQAAASEQFAGINFGIEQQAAEFSRLASIQSQTINKSIITNELEIQAQRKQAMEIDARRKQTEIIRNQQRARSLALTNATSQGAAQGSGLQGGYGQIAGQTLVNQRGVDQNLQIGRNIFGLTQNISQQKINMSDLETLFANQRADLQTQKAQMVYDYAKTNAAFQTRQADLQTEMFNAQGSLNIAQGQMEMANANSNLASTFIGMAPSLFNMGVTGANVFATNNPAANYDPNKGYGWLI